MFKKVRYQTISISLYLHLVLLTSTKHSFKSLSQTIYFTADSTPVYVEHAPGEMCYDFMYKNYPMYIFTDKGKSDCLYRCVVFKCGFII